MAENDAQTFNVACDDLDEYFKVVTTDGGCTITTADGVEWIFGSGEPDGGKLGNAIALDSKKPKFGVLLWAKGGIANGTTAINGVVTAPSASDFAVVTIYPAPTEGYFTATRMLRLNAAKDLKTSAGKKTASSSVSNAISDINKAITEKGTGQS